MSHGEKKNLLGILMDAVDRESAVDYIVGMARERRPAIISALAVHGVMTGVLDAEQKYRLNHFDLLVPDGEPVRLALNLLYQTRLRERVYGPDLMLAVCEQAARERLAIFFYGSTDTVLAALKGKLEERFPGIRIAGIESSKFRRLSLEEKREVVARIRGSGASLVFIGLGCPRQEVWAYEFRGLLPLPMVAVGAAFAFVAGIVPQAPKWMQDWGLEWVFRLCSEPRRLWDRYLLLNPAYVLLVTLQASGLTRFSKQGRPPSTELLWG